VPKVSEEHKEQVRQHLLDAAWRVVAREGVEATTTRAILDEAEMSAGALYSYFESKDELLLTLAEEKVNEALTLTAAQGDPLEGESGLLLRFAARLFVEPDRIPALTAFRGRMSTDPAVNAAIRDINEGMVERFAPLVETAQRLGDFADTYDAEALVELVDLVVDGMNRRHVTGTFATSFERVGNIAIAMFLAALQPEDTTQLTQLRQERGS
jgi:AcrR family transcriptional regulator